MTKSAARRAIAGGCKHDAQAVEFDSESKLH